jgi:hypothetical protein
MEELIARKINYKKRSFSCKPRLMTPEGNGDFHGEDMVNIWDKP